MNVAFIGIYTTSTKHLLESVVASQVLSCLKQHPDMVIMIGKNHGYNGANDHWGEMMERLANRYVIPYKIIEPDVESKMHPVNVYSVRRQMVDQSQIFVLFNSARLGVKEYIPMINKFHKSLKIVRVK